MVKGNKFKSPDFLARQQAVLQTLAPAAKASAPAVVTQQPAAGRQRPAGACDQQQAAQKVRASAAEASRIKAGTRLPAAGLPQQSLLKAREPAAKAPEPRQPTEARSQALKRKRDAEESPPGRQQPAATQGAGRKQPTALSRKQRQQGAEPSQSGAQPVLGGLHQGGPSGKQDGVPGENRKGRRQSAPLSDSQQQPDAVPDGHVKQTRQAQPVPQQRIGADPAAPAKQVRQDAHAVKPAPALATQASPVDAAKQSPRQQGNGGMAQQGRGPRSNRQHAPQKAALVTSTAMPAAGKCSVPQLCLCIGGASMPGQLLLPAHAATYLLQPAMHWRRNAA